MKQIKRIFIMMMTAAICLCSAQGLMAADLKPVNDFKTDYVNVIENTLTYVRELGSKSKINGGLIFNGMTLESVGTTGCDWLALGVGRYGIDEYNTVYLHALEEYVTENNDKLRKITDWQRIALTALALGGDPTSFGTDDNGKPINLVANGSYDAKSKLDSQGINGLIFGLILLDAYDYENLPQDKIDSTREEIIQKIIKKEEVDENDNPTGEFSLNDYSSADITGMVLQALAPYSDREDVKAVIGRAFQWLSNNQDDQGAFSSSTQQADVEGIVQVMIGMCALGIDPADPEATDDNGVSLVKNGNTIMDALGEFYNKNDGSFKHIEKETSNGMATDQGRYALVAYKRFVENGKQPTRLYDFRDEKISTVTSFTDFFACNQWYAPYVYDLADLGIIKGNPNNDGTFHFSPNEKITRAAFATILAAASKDSLTPYEGTSSFSDTAKHWAKESISWAKDHGIVSGFGNNTFGPDKTITRQDMAAMIYRYVNYKGLQLPHDKKQIKFTDGKEIQDYAQVPVSEMQQAGIISGYDNEDGTFSFKPQKSATRAQAATMISTLLKVAQ